MPKTKRIYRRRKTWGASKSLMKRRAAARKRKRSGPQAAKIVRNKLSVFQAPKGIPKTLPLKMAYNGTMIIQPDWGTVAVPGQHMSGVYIEASSLNPKIFIGFGMDVTKAKPGLLHQIFPSDTDDPNRSNIRGMDHVAKLYNNAYIDSSEIEFRIRLGPGNQPNLHSTGGTVSFFNDFYYGTAESETVYDRTTTPSELRAQPTLKRITNRTPATGEVRTISLKARYNPRTRFGKAHPADNFDLQFSTTVEGDKNPQPSKKTYFFLGFIPTHGLAVSPYGYEKAEQFPKFFLDYKIKYNVMYSGVKNDITRADLPAFYFQQQWAKHGRRHDEL